MRQIRQVVDNLKQKPEHVRRHILHVTTLGAGILLLALWVVSLGSTLSDESTQVRIGDELKPLSALKDNLVGGYISITEPKIEAEE